MQGFKIRGQNWVQHDERAGCGAEHRHWAGVPSFTTMLGLSGVKVAVRVPPCHTLCTVQSAPMCCGVHATYKGTFSKLAGCP